MLNVCALVSGGGTNLQAVFDALNAGKITNAQVSVVISNKQDAYALTRAKEHGVSTKVLSPKDFENRDKFGDALIELLNQYNIDLIILAGYLVILPEKVIKTYKNRILNVHPSLIPSHCGMGFYGLHVHESVLCRGNKVTGATVHFVDEGTDTGPIVLQKAVEVRDDDTPETLQKRVMEEAEWIILPKAIDLIAHDELVIENNIVKHR